MTLRSLLQTSSIDSFDASVLLAHVLHKSREFVIAHPEKKISFLYTWKYKRLLKKRKKNWSIASLTGHKEFFGLDFLVSKHTLVPRPETELMVEKVVEEIKSEVNGTKIILIDVGTGTGCIPVSIMTTLQHINITTPNTFATDISRSALKIAKKNAQKHNVKINFLYGNLLQPFLRKFTPVDASNIILTANLPYLAEEQFNEEPSIQHEPKSALVASDQGLALYKELLQQVSTLLMTFETPLTAFFEIDPAQTTRITTEIKKNFPQSKIVTHKDLGGRDRIICVKVIPL